MAASFQEFAAHGFRVKGLGFRVGLISASAALLAKRDVSSGSSGSLVCVRTGWSARHREAGFVRSAPPIPAERERPKLQRHSRLFVTSPAEPP